MKRKLFGLSAKSDARALRALVEENQRYQSLFVQSPWAVFSLDRQGRFVDINPAGEVLTGRSTEELLRMEFGRLIAPDQLEATTAQFLDGLGGATQSQETAIIDKQGRRRELIVTSVPIHVDGAIVGVFGVAEDVTVRKRLEGMLQLTSSAVDAATDGILIVNEDRRIVYVNEARAAMHGTQGREQLIGSHMSLLVRPGQHSKFDALVVPALKRAGTWRGEVSGRRSDGSTFPMEVSWTLAPDGHMISIARDITERHRAQEELRESEERHRRILGEIAEGYFEVDLAGNFTFVNESLCDVLGGTREQLLTLNNRDYSDDENAAVVYRHFRRVLETGETDKGFEWTFRRLDGTEGVVSTSVSLITGPDGEPLGFRGVTREMTDMHKAAEALRQSEERYRLATRATQESLWDADLVTGQTRWRGAVYAMFGYSEEAVEHDNHWWESRLHPDDRDRVLDSLTDLFNSDREMWSYEYRFRRQDDSYVSVLARGYVVRDHTGMPVRFVGSMMDFTAQKRSEEVLEQMAYEDPLTGLANRNRLLMQMEQLLQSLAAVDGQMGVFFLDLDRFKLVNDGMGHAAGDSLLIQFAERLVAQTRPQDLVARFAGDEFVVICSDITEREALRLAERVVAEIREPFTVDGREVYASVSIGVVLSSPGDTAESLLHRADAAMYSSKAAGGGAAFLFDSRMQHRALESINVETDLSRAIERGELQVHYQPIIDLETGAPQGLEALVRWERPHVGMVSASEFIPVAEKSGLILEIGQWVLSRALTQARIWRRSVPGASELIMGVNLSARQLRDPRIVETVRNAIAAADVPPQALLLEITESVLVDDVDGSLDALTRLRKLGVGIAIDDFGTGYSSLSYLSRIPATVLKVDRSFIRALDGGGGDRDHALVAAIVSMAAALDLVVIAEGVETPGQATRIRYLKAALGQGYHWSKPLPECDMTAWLRQCCARPASLE